MRQNPYLAFKILAPCTLFALYTILPPIYKSLMNLFIQIYI